MVYFIVFILQSIFNVLKVLEIKYSVTNRTKPLLINSVLISSLTIVVSFYSLEELFSGNWKIIFKHSALEIACLEKTWNSLKT